MDSYCEELETDVTATDLAEANDAVGVSVDIAERGNNIKILKPSGLTLEPSLGSLQASVAGIYTPKPNDAGGRWLALLELVAKVKTKLQSNYFSLNCNLYSMV
jgi:hypothetical protein